MHFYYKLFLIFLIFLIFFFNSSIIYLFGEVRGLLQMARTIDLHRCPPAETKNVKQNHQTGCSVTRSLCPPPTDCMPLSVQGRGAGGGSSASHVTRHPMTRQAGRTTSWRSGWTPNALRCGSVAGLCRRLCDTTLCKTAPRVGRRETASVSVELSSSRRTGPRVVIRRGGQAALDDASRPTRQSVQCRGGSTGEISRRRTMGHHRRQHAVLLDVQCKLPQHPNPNPKESLQMTRNRLPARDGRMGCLAPIGLVFIGTDGC